LTRKLVVSELLSLDGVAEQPNKFVLVSDVDDLEEKLGSVIASQDTVLLGRWTYDDCAAFWPTSDIEQFASFINGVEKYVVTPTPLEATWSSTAVIDGDLVEFVIELKRSWSRRRIAFGRRPRSPDKWAQTLRPGTPRATDPNSPCDVSGGLPLAGLPRRKLRPSVFRSELQLHRV
jgi:hypothetical protein